MILHVIAHFATEKLAILSAGNNSEIERRRVISSCFHTFRRPEWFQRGAEGYRTASQTVDEDFFRHTTERAFMVHLYTMYR
jgi:hypothetical protein